MFEIARLNVKRSASWVSRVVAGPHTRAMLTQTRHGTFLVETQDLTVGRRLRFAGEYGSQEIEIISRLANPASRILVVGAHVGTLAIPLAKRVEYVTAIEASPQTFELLQMNVELNGVRNCDCFSVAAADAPGWVALLQGRANPGGNKLVPKTMRWRYRFDKPTAIRVRAERLDDLLYGRRFDIVVVDIEGAEYRAAQGMQRILSDASALVIEFVPHHLRDVAGISVADFLSVIPAHFSKALIPSLNLSLPRQDLRAVLEGMMRRGHSESGLVFTVE